MPQTLTSAVVDEHNWEEGEGQCPSSLRWHSAVDLKVQQWAHCDANNEVRGAAFVFLPLRDVVSLKWRRRLLDQSEVSLSCNQCGSLGLLFLASVCFAVSVSDSWLSPKASGMGLKKNEHVVAFLCVAVKVTDMKNGWEIIALSAVRVRLTVGSAGGVEGAE